MKKIIFLGAFVALNMLCAFVSAINNDSLLTVWKDPSKADTSRIKAYQNYIWNVYLFSNPDTALILTQALKDFSNKKNNAYGKRQVEFLKGSIYYVKGDFPNSLLYYKNTLKWDEQLNDKGALSTTLINIGLISHEHKKDDEALTYFLKALKILDEVGDKKVMTGCLTNIGIVYYEFKDYEKAVEYFKKSLALNEEIGNKKGIAEVLHNLGAVLDRQGKYVEAIEQFNKAAKMQEELNDLQGLAFTYFSIGSANLALKEYNNAIKYCHQGLTLAEKLNTRIEQEKACGCLYDAYNAKGDFKNALKYYQAKIAVRDSMFNEENTEKITRIEMQYDFDKKEAAEKAKQEKKDALAAASLTKQRLVRNSLIGGFAVVLIFALIFFRQRNNISKEKARSEALLLNILPAQVAEELKQFGEAEPKNFEQVTVLFTDFKDFTELSVKLSPKELIKELNACFSVFDQICETYHVEKIKTIGDAYMAAGGLPIPNKNNATDVLKAAVEMRNYIEVQKTKRKEQGQTYFDIRIGIHTGPVIAGIVGVKKFQYDIWGDAVNTASRLESSCEIGKINISQQTYLLVKDDPTFKFEARGKVHAKGKGEMEMYYVS